MVTNFLIRCGVVLLVADDQRSSFMTNIHLRPVGVCLSFVRRLVYPSSAAHYARCIPILWEFCFLHLAVCLLLGTCLSVVCGSLLPLYLNSLGFLIPILSNTTTNTYFVSVDNNSILQTAAAVPMTDFFPPK